MRRPIFILAALAAVLLLVALALDLGAGQPPAARATVMPPCGTVDVDTTLTEDCHGPLVVAANGVQLDLNGKTVTCHGDASRIGIKVIGRTGVHVSDGRVTGCGTGILLNGGGGHHLNNLLVDHHTVDVDDLFLPCNLCAVSGTGDGIRLVDSNNNHINGSTVEHNQGIGVHLIASDGNRFNTMVINENCAGVAIGEFFAVIWEVSVLPICLFFDNFDQDGNSIGLASQFFPCLVDGLPGPAGPVYRNPIAGSDNNVLTSAEIIGNCLFGVRIGSGSEGNTVRSSNVGFIALLLDADTGIVVFGDKNTIRGNTANNNDTGITVFGNSNLIQSNTANNNIFDGIAVFGSSNRIQSNAASGNVLGNDLADFAPGLCLANTWKSNTAITRLDGCE